jgi:hypothetical protein
VSWERERERETERTKDADYAVRPAYLHAGSTGLFPYRRPRHIAAVPSAKSVLPV